MNIKFGFCYDTKMMHDVGLSWKENIEIAKREYDKP